MNEMVGFLGASSFGLLAFLVPAAFGLLCFLFWLWMLIDVITNTRIAGTEKIVWVIVVIFLPVVGSLIYFFVGRQKATG
jgi:uncharacterized membrane protein